MTLAWMYFNVLHKPYTLKINRGHINWNKFPLVVNNSIRVGDIPPQLTPLQLCRLKGKACTISIPVILDFLSYNPRKVEGAGLEFFLSPELPNDKCCTPRIFLVSFIFFYCPALLFHRVSHFAFRSLIARIIFPINLCAIKSRIY